MSWGCLRLVPLVILSKTNMFSKASFARLFVIASIASALASPLPEASLEKRADPIGIDVSDFTTGVNFNTVKANGVSFVYIKATEGTGARLSSISLCSCPLDAMTYVCMHV